MQFAERYETDPHTIRKQWYEYLRTAHRGAMPKGKLPTQHKNFDAWLAHQGRKRVPFGVFRQAYFSRD